MFTIITQSSPDHLCREEFVSPRNVSSMTSSIGLFIVLCISFADLSAIWSERGGKKIVFFGSEIRSDFESYLK